MKKIPLFAVVGVLLFGHASVFAERFDTSDLEGTWYLFDTTVDPATPAVFWTYGKFDSDASGNVVSGSYYVPDGSSFTVSAGQMMIDKKGVMSGTATVDMGGGNTASVVFPHGKLDGAKSNGALVSLLTIDGTNNTSMGVGSFIKGGGTFTQADLEGEWYGQGTLIELTQGAVIPVSGIFNIDQDGNVINGSYTAPNGITGTVDPAGSKVGVTGDGLISGAISLLVNFPPPVGVVPLVSVIAQGKMDQSKRSGSLVTRDFDPTMTNLLTLTNINLVKGGGSFAGTETAGTWYTYSLSVDPSIPAAYWIRGQYRIDSSGSVSEGFYVGPDGTVINATGGTVSLDNKGVISGNITTEGGQTDTVNGKVDQGKTYGTFGTVDNAGWMSGMETGTMFKDTYKSWALVLPAVMHLLDSEIAGGPAITFTPVQWTIDLDDRGPGIHTIYMLANVSPLTEDEVQDLGGELIWDETQVTLCVIEIRGGSDFDRFVTIGDIFQSNSQGPGCPSNATMEDAFDNFGLPETACVSVKARDVNHEYCAPLNVLQ